MTLVGIQGGGTTARTALTRALVGEMKARGQSVSVIAYAGTTTEIDIPGKDSYEHRRAGAREVLAVSRLRWALVHESTSPACPDMTELLARLDPVDIVFTSGFSDEADIQIELRDAGEKVNASHTGASQTSFDLDRIEQIATFILTPPPEKHP